MLVVKQADATFVKLLFASGVGKPFFQAPAENRANKTLLATSKTLGQMQSCRLSATISNVFLFDPH